MFHAEVSNGCWAGARAARAVAASRHSVTTKRMRMIPSTVEVRAECASFKNELGGIPGTVRPGIPPMSRADDAPLARPLPPARTHIECDATICDPQPSRQWVDELLTTAPRALLSGRSSSKIHRVGLTDGRAV